MNFSNGLLNSTNNNGYKEGANLMESKWTKICLVIEVGGGGGGGGDDDDDDNTCINN
jgi:hypothetical protein